MKHLLLILLFIEIMNLSAQEWDRNGPYSAHVISLAIAPSDTSVIYIGTYCDGIYKSIDGAENWINCTIENLPTWEDSLNNSPTLPCWWFGDYYPVQSIAIDPTNAEHLWIGTSGRGLFESNDGGINWQQANETLPDSLNVDHIHINENNPDKIFIGARRYLPLENGGLYYTIDGGNNWELIENVPHGDTYRITFITNEPGNEEHLYVGVDSAGEPGFGWGIMESIDGGNEWQTISDEFTFYDLSINPDDNQNMWSIILTSYMYSLLASSTDGGYTWTPYPNWTNPELWLTSLYADMEYNLYVNKGYGGIWGGIKKSSDNGNTLIYIDTLCAGRNVSLQNRCEANRENTNNIYFGTYCGIYKSDDGGLNCQLKNSNIFNSYIKDIESHPYNSDILYAGGEQGLWKSIDGGISWQMESDESINSVKFDPQHPDTLYYGGQNLMRSIDGGLTFEDIRHNVNFSIVHISINPQYTNIIYIVTGSGLYKTENYGDTWNSINLTERVNYRMITIDPNYPDTLYYADYRSVDGGNSWEHLIFTDEIIGIHPQNSNTIYYSNRNTLRVSYDWGETFHDLDTYSNWTTPVPAIGNLVFDKNNPDNMFYCTPNDGIHYSTDAGENWFVLEGNYENRTLDFIPVLEENKVYVATHGDGVWIGENISVGVDNTISSEIMQSSLQNYPNPFNPTTTINYQLPENSEVELIIYNIKGQKVKTLVNEMLPTGEHSIIWNGRDSNGNRVSSGIYFYKFNVNCEFGSVKKMLLLK